MVNQSSLSQNTPSGGQPGSLQPRFFHNPQNAPGCHPLRSPCSDSVLSVLRFFLLITDNEFGRERIWKQGRKRIE
jgi:hypothetical protein